MRLPKPLKSSLAADESGRLPVDRCNGPQIRSTTRGTLAHRAGWGAEGRSALSFFMSHGSKPLLRVSLSPANITSAPCAGVEGERGSERFSPTSRGDDQASRKRKPLDVGCGVGRFRCRLLTSFMIPDICHCAETTMIKTLLPSSFSL